jgi:hypothetical protein
MPKKIYRRTSRIRLIHRQEIWLPTVQGWGVAVVCAAALILLAMTHIHPFLAVTSPVKADVLVVEGWLTDYGLKQAVTEFESGAYRQLITTGVPLSTGSYLSEYHSFAELSAATLKALGLPKEKIVAVPAPAVVKDRTYASANAFYQWLANSNLRIEAVNLFTFDVHARRSWLIFKQVLAPKIKTGVIAVESQDYEPSKWWTSSEGVRKVISETIAYVYTRFLDWKG